MVIVIHLVFFCGCLSALYHSSVDFLSTADIAEPGHFQDRDVDELFYQPIWRACLQCVAGGSLLGAMISMTMISWPHFLQHFIRLRILQNLTQSVPPNLMQSVPLMDKIEWFLILADKIAKMSNTRISITYFLLLKIILYLGKKLFHLPPYTTHLVGIFSRKSCNSQVPWMSIMLRQ